MTSTTVTSVLLRNYVPSGQISLDDFEIKQVPAPNKDQLEAGQIIVRPLYLSVDPYVRGRMSGDPNSHIPIFKTGEPISNLLVARVVASADDGFKEGDIVTADDGKWQAEYVANASEVSKVSDKHGVSAKDYIGVLSMTGFTAYYGTVAIGKPKAGETILISSASGAVGQMATQIAKARGLRIIGVAGSDEKVEYVKSQGADAVINYKTCGDLSEAIKAAAPDGIDIYYDNVGGELLDAALENLKNNARVIICGAMSQYGNTSPSQSYGIKNMTNVLVRRATIAGYVISDHYNTPIHEQFYEEVSQLYKDGKITFKYHDTVGFENAPQALVDQFAGKHVGKNIVVV